MPGDLNDRIDEKKNEFKFGEDLVVLGRHQGIFGQFWRGRGKQAGSDDGRNLVFLVAPARVAPAKNVPVVKVWRLAVVKHDVAAGNELHV